MSKRKARVLILFASNVEEADKIIEREVGLKDIPNKSAYLCRLLGSKVKQLPYSEIIDSDSSVNEKYTKLLAAAINKYRK